MSTAFENKADDYPMENTVEGLTPKSKDSIPVVGAGLNVGDRKKEDTSSSVDSPRHSSAPSLAAKESSRSKIFPYSPTTMADKKKNTIIATDDVTAALGYSLIGAQSMAGKESNRSKFFPYAPTTMADKKNCTIVAPNDMIAASGHSLSTQTNDI